MTTFELIKAMSIDDMAKFLAAVSYKVDLDTDNQAVSDTIRGVREWLEKEWFGSDKSYSFSASSCKGKIQSCLSRA